MRTRARARKKIHSIQNTAKNVRFAPKKLDFTSKKLDLPLKTRFCAPEKKFQKKQTNVRKTLAFLKKMCYNIDSDKQSA